MLPKNLKQLLVMFNTKHMGLVLVLIIMWLINFIYIKMLILAQPLVISSYQVKDHILETCKEEVHMHRNILLILWLIMVLLLQRLMLLHYIIMKQLN